MSNHTNFSNTLMTDRGHIVQYPRRVRRQRDSALTRTLPARITRAASKQTYYTIRFFVDRERTLDAFRAYAYFRWVDDWIDQKAADKPERLAFVGRQQALIDSCYQGRLACYLSPEEKMLTDLINSDHEPNSGLQTYIRSMMAVMAFDADRRGRLISQGELDEYSRCLATAVTEALRYFIGHDDPAPHDDDRYLAVTGAHVTHMLRDTYEDIAAGYFNTAREFLDSHHISPFDVTADSYREWVRGRVEWARACFDAGRSHLAGMKNLRRRLAGYAYIARFEVVLDAIEREGCYLRSDYSERKSLGSGLKMGWSALSMLVNGLV